jgi:hypothetical protein
MLTLSNGWAKIGTQAFRLVLRNCVSRSRRTAAEIAVHRPCIDARSWLKESWLVQTSMSDGLAGVGKKRDMAGSETHDLTSRLYSDADNDMVARCRTACLKGYWTRDSNDSTGISLASVSGFNNGSQLQTRQLYHRRGRCMSGSTGQWTSME